MFQRLKQRFLAHKENKRLKEEQEFTRMIDELQKLIDDKKKEIEYEESVSKRNDH